MLICLDPGVVSGWASGDGEYGELSSRVAVWDLLRDKCPNKIIAERFVGGRQTDPNAAYVIGILFLYGDLFGIPVELKPPPPYAVRPKGLRRHEAVALALLELYGG